MMVGSEVGVMNYPQVPNPWWKRVCEQLVRRSEVFGWALALYSTWTLVWIAYQYASPRWLFLRQDSHAALWWHTCKFILWLLPVWALLRRRRVPILTWLGLNQTNGLNRGLLLTAIFLLVVVLIDSIVPGQWPQPAKFQQDQVVIILLISIWGPLLEEVLFRGYALGALQEAGSTFWRANAESTVLFALLHFPGWLFTGHSLPDCLQLGLRIGVLGFLFGALRVRNASIWSSIVIHVVNNAWRGGWFLLAFNLMRVRP
jgi:uncharacterized protein